MRKLSPWKRDGISRAAGLLWKSLGVYSILGAAGVGKKTSDPPREGRNQKTRPGGNAVLSVYLHEIREPLLVLGNGLLQPILGSLSGPCWAVGWGGRPGHPGRRQWCFLPVTPARCSWGTRVGGQWGRVATVACVFRR